MTGAELKVQPLTPDRWPDLLALFGPQGAYSNCWCTWWRQTGGEFAAGCRNAGAGNRALLERLTRDRRRPGLIAYRDDRPVGWASVAPRGEFGRVLRSPSLRPTGAHEAADPQTWAIVCFWMPRHERRRGVATALLRAAVEQARAAGASRLEAYPVDTRGERRPSAELFTGTLGMYLAAGFRIAERGRGPRPVVELELASV